MYGDSGYNRRQSMEVPFQESNFNAARLVFNLAMSRVHVTVYWVFKEINIYFTTADYKRKMKIGESPLGTRYIAAMLLTNMKNSVYPNNIAQFFKCEPPFFRMLPLLQGVM